MTMAGMDVDEKYGKRYSRSEVVRLYVAEEWTVAEIAAAVGCHRSAVYRHLDAAGVDRRDDRANNPGVPRRTHCQRDHPFDEENTRVDGNGSRHCRKCEQRRHLDRIIREAATAA